MSNLEFLVYFRSINGNNFSGSLPSELGNLANLQQLYVFTEFSGLYFSSAKPVVFSLGLVSSLSNLYCLFISQLQVH